MLSYPLPYWGFSAIMKQIIQMEHNKVKGGFPLSRNFYVRVHACKFCLRK